MAKTAKYPTDNEFGCGFVGSIFLLGGLRQKKTTMPPLPTNTSTVKLRSTPNSKKQKDISNDAATPASSRSAKNSPRVCQKPIKVQNSVRPRSSIDQNQGTRPSDATRSSTSSSTEIMSLNKVLDTNGTTTRTYSGNVLIPGHLGNLKQWGPKNLLLNNIPKSQEYHLGNFQKKNTLVVGNIIKNSNRESHQLGNIFGDWMKILDPEVLKSMGNDKYRQGNFEEALALYNQAIAFNSSQASYHSNKSAALIGLGRLMEAVFECRVAIQIEPSYHNAHYRLAKSYLRLGEAEKALYHYKHSGSKVSIKEIAQAQVLKTHLSRCTEARKQKNWITLLKETDAAFSSGADSAPQIYAMKAEALLKLRRHQEAYITVQKGPKFNIELYSQFFDSSGCADLLIILAQVYMAAGRFEDAVIASQHAASLDSNNTVNTTVKRIEALATARLNGNMLYKASKFSEACAMYSEGLELEPYNSVLLYNRGTCRSKLGQTEKAVEDCTAALNLQPSYNKARLRRADCNSQMRKWEAAIQDYEILMQETPENEEVRKGLLAAKIQLKKYSRGSAKHVRFSSKLIDISGYEYFRNSETEHKIL